MNIETTLSNTEHKQVINYNFLPQQSSGFRVTQDSNGEDVYEWVDSPVYELSSVKLIKMLRMVKQHCTRKDNKLRNDIEQELAQRGNETQWNLPH